MWYLSATVSCTRQAKHPQSGRVTVPAIRRRTRECQEICTWMPSDRICLTLCCQFVNPSKNLCIIHDNALKNCMLRWLFSLSMVLFHEWSPSIRSQIPSSFTNIIILTASSTDTLKPLVTCHYRHSTRISTLSHSLKTQNNWWRIVKVNAAQTSVMVTLSIL